MSKWRQKNFVLLLKDVQNSTKPFKEQPSCSFSVHCVKNSIPILSNKLNTSQGAERKFNGTGTSNETFSEKSAKLKIRQARCLSDETLKFTQWRTQTRSLSSTSRCLSRPLCDPENKGQRQQGVNFDTLGSWNNRIDMSILMEESIKTGRLIPKVALHDISHSSLIGRRKSNEDRCDVKELAPGLQYFAIFDGHGGDFAVDYVCQNMVYHILHWYSRLSSLSDVLTKSFININNLLSRHVNMYYLETEKYSSGTTATVCLLKDSTQLVIGHVGDSRAVLCRNGEAKRLTTEHSPEYEEEAKRIQKLGGKIVENSLGQLQVNGRLAMTRSLGDVELEQVGVIATPHIKTVKIKHGSDAFLVLDTDGVNFVLNDQETVNLVSSCPTPREAAKSLVDEALHFGSEDNSTCVVVPFGAWGKFRDADKSMPYSLGRNLLGNRYKYG